MREAISEGNEVGGRRDDIADREADEVEGSLSEDCAGVWQEIITQTMNSIHH